MEGVFAAYQEFKAFLNHLPQGGYVEDGLTIDFNALVDQLSKEAQTDYSDYKLDTDETQSAEMFFTKGARLLARVNATARFEKDVPNFRADSTGPAFAMNQTNNQEVSTTVIVSIVSEVTEQLTRAETNYSEGTRERSFIDKVKAGVKTVKNIGELLSLVLSTGQELGMDLAQIVAIFHH